MKEELRARGSIYLQVSTSAEPFSGDESLILAFRSTLLKCMQPTRAGSSRRLTQERECPDSLYRSTRLTRWIAALGCLAMARSSSMSLDFERAILHSITGGERAPWTSKVMSSRLPFLAATTFSIRRRLWLASPHLEARHHHAHLSLWRKLTFSPHPSTDSLSE